MSRKVLSGSVWPHRLNKGSETLTTNMRAKNNLGVTSRRWYQGRKKRLEIPGKAKNDKDRGTKAKISSTPGRKSNHKMNMEISKHFSPPKEQHTPLADSNTPH